MRKTLSMQRRKLLLFLPLIILPFACLMFWLLGGGQVPVNIETKPSGLNASLPSAKNDSTGRGDKLSFYAVADADSAKRMEQIKLDPYRKNLTADTVPIENDVPASVSITRKMAALRKQVMSASTRPEPDYPQERSIAVKTTPKLQVEPDPEMEAINATLDKLMAVQQPHKNSEAVHGSNMQELPVNTGEHLDETFFGKRHTRSSKSGFYDAAATRANTSALSAQVSSNQVLRNGSTVKLELTVPVIIAATAIPAGTAIYGIAQVEGERVRIHIPSIRYEDKLLPVSLDVYGMDGLEGIHLPGSVSREVAKESADNLIQSTGITAFDPSVKTQLVSAGIGAARSLLSKKVKQVNIHVNSAYKVLLKDNKQTN